MLTHQNEGQKKLRHSQIIEILTYRTDLTLAYTTPEEVPTSYLTNPIPEYIYFI